MRKVAPFLLSLTLGLPMFAAAQAPAPTAPKAAAAVAQMPCGECRKKASDTYGACDAAAKEGDAKYACLKTFQDSSNACASVCKEAPTSKTQAPTQTK
ncbi:hypothetical protein [Usitatibacter palustris]|uniref:Uncharacterized protein n=1 Tax=Usitatibacter palustris TaxID=2732487 RepID=A0A6M4HDH4_9PROT|nr:hypothetical protein [Usitatibacter palustris]QJR16634.1 hypothetical protein DSM104440_03469 [Usitatibacter palustris]